LLGIVEGYISPEDLPLAFKLLIGLTLELLFLAWTVLPVNAEGVARSDR
jgi:hypothetical protein